MIEPCDMCDAHTVPETAYMALVLDVHRATHFDWDRVREAFARFGDAVGMAQIATTTFGTLSDATQQRRNLEGEIRSHLAMGDRRGHKRAVKALRTHDALHPRRKP